MSRDWDTAQNEIATLLGADWWTAENFSKSLKFVRKDAVLTQKALSAKFNIPKRTIEDWEGKKNNPSEYMAKLLVFAIYHL